MSYVPEQREVPDYSRATIGRKADGGRADRPFATTAIVGISDDFRRASSDGFGSVTYSCLSGVGRAREDPDLLTHSDMGDLWTNFVRWFMTLNMQEWFLVLVGIVVLGAFWLRGHGSRSEY